MHFSKVQPYLLITARYVTLARESFLQLYRMVYRILNLCISENFCEKLIKFVAYRDVQRVLKSSACCLLRMIIKIVKMLLHKIRI